MVRQRGAVLDHPVGGLERIFWQEDDTHTLEHTRLLRKTAHFS